MCSLRPVHYALTNNSFVLSFKKFLFNAFFVSSYHKGKKRRPISSSPRPSLCFTKPSSIFFLHPPIFERSPFEVRIALYRVSRLTFYCCTLLSSLFTMHTPIPPSFFFVCFFLAWPMSLVYVLFIQGGAEFRPRFVKFFFMLWR